MNRKDEIKASIRKNYARVAKAVSSGGCCGGYCWNLGNHTEDYVASYLIEAIKLFEEENHE